MKIINFIYLLIFLFLPLHGLKAQEEYKTLVFKGNKKFDKKKFEEASISYLEAQKLKPNDFAAQYNLGNALYKNQKFQEAESAYLKAEKLALSKQDKAAALHNLGNAYMKNNQIEKAAESYKKSLKINPNSAATLENYQIAKKKESTKQKQNQNQQNQQNQNNEKQEQKEDSKEKGEQNGDQKKQKPNGEDGSNKQGKNPDGTSKSPKNENPNLSKSDEKAILDRINQKEKETARRILNKNSNASPESNEKNW